MSSAKLNQQSPQFRNIPLSPEIIAMVAQLLTKRENVQRQPKSVIDTLSIADWDSFLYSYWVKKIALNPQFYDDAKTNHRHCRCCSRVTPEGRKR